MQQIELELAGGGVLTVSLRASLDAMPAVKQRPLVLVVPGGGYDHVSPREGDPVALQFAAAGYHTAVLTYSVGEGAQNYRPLRQLNEALALLRQNAGEWHILPDKIAVCGFSAGGHLALSAAVLDIPGETAQQRPNAVILGYPVVTAGEFAHRGSFVQLAGSEDAAAQQAFTLEDKVTSDTPPVFVWHTMEDQTVPVENTLLLLTALRRAGVPPPEALQPRRQGRHLPARPFHRTVPDSAPLPRWCFPAQAGRCGAADCGRRHRCRWSRR